MSTRCQIGYYDKLPEHATATGATAMLYRHSDGYPQGDNGVLVPLAEFLAGFGRDRGLGDHEYLMARLLITLANRTDASFKAWWKAQHPDKPAKSDYTGYGICGDKELHGDIEFLYCISPEGVQVFDTYNEKALLNPDESAGILKGEVPAQFRNTGEG